MLRRMMIASSTTAPPSSLAGYFGSGQRGFWIDPSDLTTMWQDAAGTTPVTAAGQSVGLIHDKSGNANHFSQSTNGKRPVLQQDGAGKYYLQFASSGSRCLVCTNTAALQPGTDSIVVLSGVRFDSFSNTPVIFSRAVAAGTTGRYWNQANGTNFSTNFDSLYNGAIGDTAAFSDTASNNVLTNVFDRVAGSLYSKKNGAAFGTPRSFSPDYGASLTAAINSRIGAYGNASDNGETSNYMNGRIYGLVVRLTPTISTSDISAMEALMAAYI